MRAIALGWILTSAVAATAAHADDKVACVSAASAGQSLRDAKKLVEARAEFRTCAGAQCPAIVRTDCALWLAEVEERLPTVVVSAKDGAGIDLFDVSVRIDGQALLSTLDGRAIPVNPGVHAFHFEAADGTTLDRNIAVPEGARNQAIAVTLQKVSQPLVATAPVGASGPAVSSDSAKEGATGWRTAGWVLGGAGVVGLAVGAAFGAAAIGDKNDAQCGSDGCDAEPLRRARSAATGANIAFAAGGVLLASGAAFVLFAPRAKHEKAASLRVTPLVTENGGAVAVSGGW